MPENNVGKMNHQSVWPPPGVKWYYWDDYCALANQDCREVLPTLAPGSVDLVLTDPPYGINFPKYESHDDCEEGYAEFVWNVTERCESKVKNGWVCVFQAAKKCREWHSIFPRPFRLIALPKTFVQIFVNMPGPTWATDYALIWRIGKPVQKSKGRDWKVSDTANMRFDRGHPCARPLPQISFLVDCLSEEGATILDPFAGSGTTLRAAKDMGRKSVGVEVCEAYCEIAAKRLDQGVLEYP